MDGEQLRAVQAPLKQRYRDQAEQALIVLEADGDLDPSEITCSVRTGQALVQAGLRPATGGDGTAACSGDMLLQALVACAGVTLRAVATSIQVPVRSGRVHAEGDLDVRGTLGVAGDAPVGFRAIRLQFDLDTDADDATVARLLELTERYCVVLQTLVGTPALTVTVA